MADPPISRSESVLGAAQPSPPGLLAKLARWIALYWRVLRSRPDQPAAAEAGVGGGVGLARAARQLVSLAVTGRVLRCARWRGGGGQ